LRGDVYREQGAWEAARASYEEALALLEGTGEGINEAHLLTQLGRVEEQGGQLVAARSLHERALDLFRRAGNLNGEATTPRARSSWAASWRRSRFSTSPPMDCSTTAIRRSRASFSPWWTRRGVRATASCGSTRSHRCASTPSSSCLAPAGRPSDAMSAARGSSGWRRVSSRPGRRR
ncbi:MAG: tetratricopeptide repeat protein, partial [bacterium]|nr:tetratricopeptide repeat protein [bacterium]